MRLVPDHLRGRVSTTDRAAELLVWSVSTAIAGWSLRSITARTLTVIAGLLSTSSGLVWLVLFAARRLRLSPSADPELMGGEPVVLSNLSGPDERKDQLAK